jgi:hypothetical protein
MEHAKLMTAFLSLFPCHSNAIDPMGSLLCRDVGTAAIIK